LRTVPGGLDILIAGSSCVDISKLNSRKKTEGGETEGTLQGILKYAENYRPKFIILENVRDKKHWDTLQTIIEDIGYMGEWVDVDTKDYYIPHTRQRTYMLAVDSRICPEPKNILNQWQRLMSDFKRKASSPMDDFLLKNTDQLLINGLDQLTRGNKQRMKEIEWPRDKAIHRQYQNDLHLGSKRPITQWQEGGSIKVSPAIFGPWLKGRPDREKDVIDISYKRGVRRGYDQNFTM
jgi:site-specific DNA-cytosine methylase